MTYKIANLLLISLFFFVCVLSDPVKVMAEATASSIEVEQEIRLSIRKLADEIGERNLYHAEKLELAKRWIEAEFKRYGYSDTALLPVFVEGSKYGLNIDTKAWNVEAVLPGTDPNAGTIVVGAHYDTKVAMDGWHDHWPPKPSRPGTPGANDNGSGVAALLYLAKKMRNTPHLQTVRFVAFANEEPPFYQTDAMGSYVYAKGLSDSGARNVKMISLETLGCYSVQPRKKRNPLVWFLGLVDTPNYVAFLGNSSSRNWLKESSKYFEQLSKVGLRTATVPAVLDSIAWSDDWAFWQFGYPAFSITDTAFLRSDVYHETSDTWDRIDYESMAEVVKAIVFMVGNLADR